MLAVGTQAAVAAELRLQTTSGAGQDDRSVQVFEIGIGIGIDTLAAAAIQPFWQAVLGYADEPGRSGP
jgi:4a-hydroxytetrahydrobiopterin dehydratase